MEPWARHVHLSSSHVISQNELNYPPSFLFRYLKRLERSLYLGLTETESVLFTLFLLLFQTRTQDWLAGALNSSYFVKRLEDMEREVVKHEKAPQGWLMHWSRYKPFL